MMTTNRMMTMYRKPIDTRNINTKHDETVETPCDGCNESSIKVVRVEVETHKTIWDSKRTYLSVKLRCECDNCGFKQTVQLVEMP